MSSTDSTPPAEILRAAANHLDTLDKAATPGRWYAYADHVVIDIQRCTCAGGVGMPHEPHCGCEAIGGPFGTDPTDGSCPDAALIAALRPLAPVLARMLRWEAGCVETAGATPNLLDLAAAVLGRDGDVPPSGQGDPS